MDWRVTRSLVSYDGIFSYTTSKAEIEGSPDHWWVTTIHSYVQLLLPVHWRVTRSLVSYDNFLGHSLYPKAIEGSPDHWWVTTIAGFASASSLNWRVTRSLVSYDLVSWTTPRFFKLKGHQIIGELRPKEMAARKSMEELKGHQIIGELRRCCW